MRNDIFGALDNLNEHSYGSTYYSPEQKKFVKRSIEGPTLLEIYLPIDSERDFKKPDSMYNRLEQLKNGKVECIYMYANPIYTEERNISKIENRVYVQMPREIDDVFYIPIVLKNNGIDFAEGYHRYFLRSFNKRTRHLILGFLYEYGSNITSICCSAGSNKGMFTKNDITTIQLNACRYKDSDAPKRINLGC